MNDQTIYIIVGMLGVLSHSLLKLNSLSQDARIANLEFHWFRDYVKVDMFAILASLVSVFGWLLIFEEAASKYNSIQGLARTSFFIMGMVGSYALQLLLSVSKRRIRKVIDIKTNVADGIVPPVNEQNKEGLEVIKEN